MPYLCTAFDKNAQMAELVDALVSNTNGAIRAGSIPALGTEAEDSSESSTFLFSLPGEGKGAVIIGMDMIGMGELTIEPSKNKKHKGELLFPTP